MNPTSQTTGKLGLLDCVMLLIGSMVGSAIFSLSGLTMLLAGPSAILSWLFGGAILFSYGMFMAELACRYPKSGGPYYFPRQVFSGALGQWLGWISCWSSILTNIIAVAFSAIYVGVYLSVAFPFASGLQIPLAMASIIFCLVMNLLSINLTGKINLVIVLALLAAMGLYVFRAFFGGAYSPEMLTPFFTQGAGGAFGFLKGIPIAMIGYSGIVALAFMADEVRNVQRTMPLAMMVAMIFVVLIYALMLFSTLGLVSAGYLIENPGQQFIPIFAACFTKLQDTPWLAGVVSIAAVLALLTTMLVCVSINARAIQAAAEDHCLPGFLAKVNPRGIPVQATFITAVLAMICACFPERTQQIVNFGAVFNITIMLITMLSVIKSRRDSANAPHKPAFTVPGGNWHPYFILAVLVICNGVGLISNGWGLWIFTIAGLALGVGIKFSILNSQFSIHN